MTIDVEKNSQLMLCVRSALWFLYAPLYDELAPVIPHCYKTHSAWDIMPREPSDVQYSHTYALLVLIVYR
ncbi:hypothetical protein Q7M76_00330 [Candidatus Liberibacter asiaticus]|uniref:hypothetical protein n=1 Tax=Liberibacter asiaticus TaxID=34021 RepID=UPI00044CDCD8|nr:hypothetical protein [Candidatus Liberibacter asiaticus]ALK06845.1 hypothetical protein CD16_00330 [Candidatus Liberibacter asiaticus]ASK52313.1 hypothetical protein B2I23_00340 [Candidatus Liberibacter asiaticus]AWL13635.1 hypothetical protein DIC79_00355 [Candidatus Liberibacter asiaticus]KIH95415.1 hypothetical protein RH08_00365 [Candidatus Liberibacter asiaticus]KPG63420.1 hypothetical protein AL011_00305 [Candidatus Liberibacter asiaticus]